MIARNKSQSLRQRALSLLGALFVRAEVFGPSMLPELAPGDRILVWRTSRLSVGDIAVFEHPCQPGQSLVKRIVEISDQGLVVVGDNLEASVDSRQFGPVPWSSVVGRAWYRYFPADARGRLRSLR